MEKYYYDSQQTAEEIQQMSIQIEEGDVFSRDKILNAFRNLMNLQYFSNVIPEPQQGSETDLVDIVFLPLYYIFYQQQHPQIEDQKLK